MKKILAIVLILLMALQTVPFSASAAEEEHHHGEEPVEAAATEEEKTEEEVPPAEEEPVSAESGEEEAPAGLSPRLPEAPGEGLTVDDGSAAGTEALPTAAETDAVTAPTGMWVAGTAANGIPMDIDVFVSGTQTSGTTNARTYTYTSLLCLPGSADVSACFLSWDGEAQATVDGTTVDSGMCAVPPVGATKSYSIKVGRNTYVYNITTYQGSAAVTAVFIDIDESNGNPTIAQMDADPDHNVTCTGRINIAGTWYAMPKMKGRGNASWSSSDDKKPYNITLDGKIQFPGIDEAKTKKWSFLAESLDRSLLCNRIGFRLAKEMGVGQDAAPADVWMNGEYQGCYTVTPKTDSYVTKNGWMIEQDNYKEDPVAQGGDPQFQLEGLEEASGWSSCYNRITVKKMGDDFLGYDAAGEADESAENLTDKANNVIKPWLQDAWDAIRSSDGYNAKGKYYTDYIDIESFAKMYLMQEYDKNYDVCAGSLLYHRDGQTDADKLFAGPIWDLDNSMGSTCSNSNLGSQSDRRSAQGDFIENITEYKTSIYKALGRHADFMEEVKFQYNRYRDFFDALDDDLDQMAEELEDSAVMNEKKVKNLGNGQYTNLHYYRSATTLGSGEYRQSYVATNQWSDYTANLKTYITVRSLWFHNSSKYYDPDFVDPLTCEHQYQTVTVPATCTADGSVTYTCPICRNTYTEVLPKIPHDYQNGVCTMCGEALLTATFSCSPGVSITVYETQDLNGAHVDNAETAHPRDSDSGLIDCSGNGQINFVVVLSEGYVLDDVTVAPKNYKNLKLPDETGIENGYRLTKVTGDLTITVAAHCEHSYTETVTPPTCTEAGYTTHTCRYCGDSFVDTEVVALGHDYVDHAAQAATCTGIGWEAYQTCSRCDYTTYQEIPATGHSWNAPTYTWATDNSSVTAARVCANDASHTETETAAATGTKTKDPTCTEKGETTYTSAAFTNSAFAAQTKTVADIPATDHSWNEPTYNWSSDNKTVTATRTCKNDASHTETETANTTSAVTTQPTCTAKGKTTYTATFTNSAFKTQTKVVENVDALGHSWGTPTYSWSTDNSSVTATRTCTRDASHKETETVNTTSAVTTQPTCEGMGKTTYTAVFTNSAFAAQTKVVENVPATGHTPGEAKKENVKASSCTGEGSYELAVYCTVCGKELSRTTETVAALGHSWGAPTYTWATDYSSVTATRTCTRDSSHKETETVKTTSAVTKASTCETKGETTYTATFTNSAFTKQTKTVDNIAALGHSWGTPTYTWATDYSSVTATRICTRDSSHKETETVKTTSAVTKTATCETKGETTYTATFTNSAFAKQTKTVDNIAALGHSWGSPTYTWSADNSSVTATRICTRDASHKETEAVKTTSAVTKAATCETKGETTYTATFTNSAFTKQTKTVDNIDALGHSWGTPMYSWSSDNSSVTATRVCTRDSSHKETETVKTTSAVTKQPTCTEKGERKYTAMFTNSAFATQTKTEEIAAKGHSWNTPTYSWSSDNRTVTATRTCRNDASHKETETATATSTVTKQPTCTEKGERTYTATFTNSAFATQTKTEEIAATGHSWNTPTYAWSSDNRTVTATRTCGNDASHKETETATATSAVTKQPTCTEDGETTYTATFTNSAFAKQTKTVADIPATGHSWNTPTYTWAADNSTATAERVCRNDASHKDSETVKTTSEVTKQPTCEEPGETTWTAAFTNKAFTSQTKTEKNIPALGHLPGDPVTENVVEPTEQADGSHDEVVYCMRCGKELSRTTVTDTFVKPVFKSQSLVLSGQIGLNFFLKLPEIEGVDYTKSYMEFSVSGKDGSTSVDPYDPSFTNASGEYYGFTCYVNSIQMADTITATFHYGDGKTVSKEYSVAKYVEFFEKNAGSFNAKTIALIHSIADFGHYEQIYLASINDWAIGSDHAEMARHYTDSFDYASIQAAVNGKAFAKSLDGSKVEKATYKLHLDSATTVDVFLKPASGVTLTASATFNGKTYRAEKQADGRYLVRIPDISAHQLGDMITITGDAGGAFTVKVSALSYVRSVLANDMPVPDKDGLSALYQYYAAVMAYRA